jgi:hypothetical protein
MQDTPNAGTQQRRTDGPSDTRPTETGPTETGPNKRRDAHETPVADSVSERTPKGSPPHSRATPRRAARRCGGLALAGAALLQSLATASGLGGGVGALALVRPESVAHSPVAAPVDADATRAMLIESFGLEAEQVHQGLRLAWVPASGGEADPGACRGRSDDLTSGMHSTASPGGEQPAGTLLLAGLREGDRYHLLWEPHGGGPVRLAGGVAGHGTTPRLALPLLGGDLLLVRSTGGGSGPAFARLTLPARQRPNGSGEILITEFLRDPVAVSDSFGEWFEVYNSTNQPIDLEGWSLTDEGNDATVLDNGGLGIVVPPRGYLVLGREVSPAFNGGALVHAEYQGFTLANGADEIVLRRPGGRLVDRVAYDSSAGWPGAPGASAHLAQGRLGSTWNDDPADWCTATAWMSGGDLGSPAVANGPCP